MILGIVATIISLIGLIGFFTGHIIFAIIGGIAGLIENIVGIVSKEQNNLITAGIAVVIGIIYSTRVGLSFWVGALIGLCFESVIMGVFSLVLLIAALIPHK